MVLAGAAGASTVSVQPGPAAALLQLQRLVSGLNSGLDLEQTLTAVVECVVAGLGFGVAVVSVVEPDGDLRVAAVAGDPTARDALQDQQSTRAEWDRLLSLGDPVGPSQLLRLVDHRRDGAWDDKAMPTWVPESVCVDRVAGDDRVAWHPLDALFAPLASASAGLLGVLSVDVPLHGLRPGHDQLALLEMFVLHAATPRSSTPGCTARSSLRRRSLAPRWPLGCAPSSTPAPPRWSSWIGPAGSGSGTGPPSSCSATGPRTCWADRCPACPTATSTSHVCLRG